MVLGSALSSPRGVPIANYFGAFLTKIEASGAIVLSTPMFPVWRWITLDFQKVLPAYRPGFYLWYVSIQLRNLGTIYWVQWRSQEVGVMELRTNSVWYIVPVLEEGLKTCWRSELRAKHELIAKPEIERGRVWRRGPVSPSSEIFWKFILETMQFGVYIVEEKIYIFP